MYIGYAAVDYVLYNLILFELYTLQKLSELSQKYTYNIISI